MFGNTDACNRPLLMGIVNVTPDSFSDGGAYFAADAAVAHALELVGDGADIVDVGGESSRPGALPVPRDVQMTRVVPVIRGVLQQSKTPVLISVDTRDSAVATAALDAGAGLVNDISAGRDPAMLNCVAANGAGIVLMHMQGEPATMQAAPRYSDVVAEVREYLMARVDAALAAGIDERRIAIDPGIGFGKSRVHNLRLLAALAQFVECGFPVVLGTSRKRFMGAICAETDFTKLTGATCATTALGVVAGVRVFRVHDIRENRQAADVAWAGLFPDGEARQEVRSPLAAS